MPDRADRLFTLDSARALLPRILELTAQAAQHVDPLMARLEDLDADDPEHSKLSESVSRAVTAWAEAVQDLGAEAKGLWLVDFDAGSGYYCWKYPEATVSHYHGYEEGFAGRMKIV